jgi:hypothetical protein
VECNVSTEGGEKMIESLKLPRFRPIYAVVGVGVLVAFGWQFDLRPVIPEDTALQEHSLTCQEIVQPKAALSREQLAKLLSTPERSQRRNVQAILKEPYCRLPSLSIRAGAKTEREMYPLAFDPQTSLVVVYEGETYVGYGVKEKVKAN